MNPGHSPVPAVDTSIRGLAIVGGLHWRWPILQLVATACVAVVVAWVEDFGLIMAWNLFPLILALGSMAIVRSSLGSPDVRIAGAVFWLTELSAVLALHLAWQFDLQGFATRSSTAGLMFLVAPVYFVVLGLILAGLSIGVAAFVMWWHRGA
jgi:hypothetical protein